jgi:ABC-type glutathione transport system ATPase component
VLEFDEATKRFGPLAALDGCTFAARPGRLTGFLGPNGAGKTTAMRAVFGLVDLDSGIVRRAVTLLGDRRGGRGHRSTPAAFWRCSARALMPSSILRIIAKSPNSVRTTATSVGAGCCQL